MHSFEIFNPVRSEVDKLFRIVYMLIIKMIIRVTLSQYDGASCKPTAFVLPSNGQWMTLKLKI